MLLACALLALVLLPGAAVAQAPATPTAWADSARRAIDAANVAGDLNGLMQARALVERALTRFPEDPWLLHYRGFALYREAMLRLGRDGVDVAELLDAAETSLAAARRKAKLPETFALLSSIVGQRIGSNPLKGMVLGPKSNRLMDDAVELGPDNPRVWLMRGIGAMYTPAMFGGGEERAEQYLRRALALFEHDAPTPPAPAWGRDEAWVWLGQLYVTQKKWDAARAAYERALQIAPGNEWVKQQLLPELAEKRTRSASSERRTPQAE